MKIIVTKTYEEMSSRGFEIVKSLVKSKPDAVIGFATGSTPLGLYSLMKKDYEENKTSYKNITSVNLDEYVGLGIDSDQSYIYFMKKNLFDGIDILPENTNIENGLAPDPEKECERYNSLLHLMPQDLQILGIGSDGHIAFNEPGTPFDSETHIAKLAESTIKDNSRLFSSIDEVPKTAYTMGLKNIMNAKKIIILANGKNKAKAVHDMVLGRICEEVPASILQLHPDCTLICDEDSAYLLD